MKRKILNITLVMALILSSLFMLTACGNTETKKEENKQKNSLDQGVIGEFFDAISKGDSSKAKEYINYEAFLAIQMLEDIDVSLDEACQVVKDFGKGADYIKQNHKEFMAGWEDMDVGDLDDDKVNTLNKALDTIKESIGLAIDELAKCNNIEIKNIEKKDTNESGYDVEGITTYEVSLKYNHEGEDEEETMNISTIKIDGKEYILSFD